MRPGPPLPPVLSNVNASGSRCCQLTREKSESRPLSSWSTRTSARSRCGPERQDLAKCAVAAVRQVGLVRKWVEEVEDAPGRRIDSFGRDAVARKLDAGHRVTHDEGVRREIAVAHGRRRHDRLRTAAERLQLAAFVVGEKERPVGDDSPAEAVAVAIIVGVGVRIAARDAVQRLGVGPPSSSLEL